MNLEVEGKRIGPDEKCFLICEMSANHDRDLDQALALVDCAADAGWDSIKLQTYTADSLTLDSAHPSMSVDPIWGYDNLHSLYEAAAMPMEFHAPLFERARQRGLVPFTSIYDPRDLDYVEQLGCCIYKVASFEMTFDDLLTEIALTKKPIIMSTGMANLSEVDHAIEVLTRHNSGPIVLLHCVSAYPAPLDQVNLKAMISLKTRFGEMVGFSDHTLGERAAIAATAMGAVAIEKHITNDSSRKGPDHRFSATPDVLAKIAEGVKEIALALGTGTKSTASIEKINKKVGRRSAFALNDLPAGKVITRSDFRFVRPGAGIPANDTQGLLGRRLINSVSAGHPITYEDIEP